jgi:hypothetical protein
MKLTHNMILKLVCPAGKKDKLLFDDEQRGLALRVGATAKAGSLDGKSFFAQYSYGGIKRRVPLGACSAISLGDARKAACAVKGDVAHGKDPAHDRRAAAQAKKLQAADDALTVAALIADWKALHLRARRASYADEATRAIRSVFKKYLDWPAASLDRKTVVRELDKLVKEGSPIMAARAGAYLGAAYEWAVKRGTFGANPFAKLARAPTSRRDRVLSDDEIAAVWRATEAPGAFNAIVRGLILTGQRRGDRPSKARLPTRGHRGGAQSRVGLAQRHRRNLPAPRLGRRETGRVTRMG